MWAYEDVRAGLDLAARDQVDHAGQRLPLVDRVGDHPLQRGAHPDRRRAWCRPGCRRCRRGSGRRASPRPARARARGRSSPPCRGRSAAPGRASRPASPSRRCRSRAGRGSSSAKPATMPACVEPVTEQTMIVSKKTPSSRSCSATSTAQPAKPRPPSGWSEAPAGIAYGLPPRLLHVAQRLLPRLLEADAEAGLDEPHVGAAEARHEDVADPVVGDVGPVDPALLHQHALQAEAGGDRRHLPRVVGLHAADRDQRVAARARARRRRGTRACGSCCRRRRCPSCSRRASPTAARRRGARSGGRAGGSATARTAAARGRTSRATSQPPWELP